jgi:hypothetical protein
MDIGLACQGCGRKVRLERYEFDRRFRGFLAHGGEARHDAAAESGQVGSDSPAGGESPTTQ